MATFSSSTAEASVQSEREQSLEAPRQAQQALESFTRTEPLPLSPLDAAAPGERVGLEAAAAQLAAAHEEKVSAARSLLLLEPWGPLSGGPGGPWTPQNKTGGPVIGLDLPDCF